MFRWITDSHMDNPETSGLRHPEHPVLFRDGTVAFPIHPSGLLGWKTRRACKESGGHWWHPSDAMIEWKCCQCGASRDGMPRDGR
jgi:hypothetical protein